MGNQMQTIKRTVLFLCGVLLIVCGYKGKVINDEVNIQDDSKATHEVEKMMGHFFH
ncbi:MAG: hypothetical protein LBV43_00810 [Prevotella sp.]|jgi:hypothetical protein|nr:hypothetical protein [Prevotella sp.]